MTGPVFHTAYAVGYDLSPFGLGNEGAGYSRTATAAYKQPSVRCESFGARWDCAGWRRKGTTKRDGRIFVRIFPSNRHSTIMPRRPRAVFPGVAHHITQRGNNRQPVWG